MYDVSVSNKAGDDFDHFHSLVLSLSDKVFNNSDG